LVHFFILCFSPFCSFSWLFCFVSSSSPFSYFSFIFFIIQLSTSFKYIFIHIQLSFSLIGIKVSPGKMANPVSPWGSWANPIGAPKGSPCPERSPFGSLFWVNPLLQKFPVGPTSVGGAHCGHALGHLVAIGQQSLLLPFGIISSSFLGLFFSPSAPNDLLSVHSFGGLDRSPFSSFLLVIGSCPTIPLLNDDLRVLLGKPTKA
jgi:hypothetical protein